MFRAWSASFLAHHPLPTKQAGELLWLQPTLERSAVLTWIKAARVDVLIDGGLRLYDWLKGFRIPEELGYATLGWQDDQPTMAGVDQQAAVLGANAVDLLVEQFHHNERGTPKHPKIVMTEGTWRDGTTVRRVR